MRKCFIALIVAVRPQELSTWTPDSSVLHSSIRINQPSGYVQGQDEHQSGFKTQKGLPGRAPECAVGRQGNLREVKNTDILNKLFDANVTITAHDISVISANTNTTFPIWSIRTPIITWPNSQSCFELSVYPTARYSLCADSPFNRDSWLVSLYHALYCLSGTKTTKWFTEEGDTLAIPKKSTKSARWLHYTDSLGVASSTSTTTTTPQKHTAEASGTSSKTAKPKLTVEITDLDKESANVLVNGVAV